MDANISFNLGTTNYGQPITLSYSKSSAGRKEWHLRKDAADQRDDTCLISGITDEMILAMADAVRSRKAFEKTAQ